MKHSQDDMSPTINDRFDRKRWKIEVDSRIDEATKKSFDTWLLTVSSAAIGAFVVSPTFRADIATAGLKSAAAFAAGSLCLAIAACVAAKLCFVVIWHYKLMALRKDESDSWAAVANEPTQLPALPSRPDMARVLAVLFILLELGAFLVGFISFARVVILTLTAIPAAKS